MTRNSRELPPSHKQGGDANGNIDQKDQAPVERHQDATDKRAKGRAETTYSSPGSHRAAAFLGWENGKQKAQRCRRHQSCSSCLRDPEHNQRLDAVGHETSRRCRGEQGNGQQETPISPVSLG